MSRLLIAALVVTAAGCSNGFFNRGGACCQIPAAGNRDVTYVGTVPAADGGVPTQVKLVVSGELTQTARLTFVRDGVEITETFWGR